MKSREIKIELREIFQSVVSYLEKSTDSDWSAASVNEMKQLMTTSIEVLENQNQLNTFALEIAFAPTSFLQEIAMANNWSDAYLDLAERFDLLISRVNS